LSSTADPCPTPSDYPTKNLAVDLAADGLLGVIDTLLK
jgi:hypothetical protein